LNQTNPFENQLQERIQTSQKLELKLTKVFEHIDGLPRSDGQQVLLEVCRRVHADLSKCPEAAHGLELYLISWLTRNLFELMFITEFICGAPENILRFQRAAYRDEVDIISKLETIESKLGKELTEGIKARKDESAAVVHAREAVGIERRGQLLAFDREREMVPCAASSGSLPGRQRFLTCPQSPVPRVINLDPVPGIWTVAPVKPLRPAPQLGRSLSGQVKIDRNPVVLPADVADDRLRIVVGVPADSLLRHRLRQASALAVRPRGHCGKGRRQESLP
jgi:hypothetical protein